MEQQNKNEVLKLIEIKVDGTIKTLCECLEKLERGKNEATTNEDGEKK